MVVFKWLPHLTRVVCKKWDLKSAVCSETPLIMASPSKQPWVHLCNNNVEHKMAQLVLMEHSDCIRFFVWLKTVFNSEVAFCNIKYILIFFGLLF